MPVVKKINMKGDHIGEVELSESVFGITINQDVVHQVVVAQLANRRLGTHDTKDRGDVRGGGRKPWRQKHTGRARAGSNRSPVWVGGGVAHGPHPVDYHQKVNKKVRRLAIRSVLTLKAKDSNIFVLEKFDLDEPKTKVVVEMLSKIDAAVKPLFVLHDTHIIGLRSVANIPGAKVMNVDSLNVYDVLKHKNVIATPEAIKRIEEVFGE